MKNKTLTCVPLAELRHQFDSLEQKVSHAADLQKMAAKSGSDLVVFPEMLNSYRSNDPHTWVPISLRDVALDDWVGAMEPLIDGAKKYRVATAIPVLIRENNALVNCFYMVSKDGDVLGRYDKSVPTPDELEGGVVPGRSGLIEWEGLKVGGAICFDVYFPEVFERQADLGADLFIVPSLTAGGLHLNFYALTTSAPILLAYPEWSRIIDVDGRELAQGGFRNETLRFGFGPALVSATINFNRVVLYADLNQTKINDILKDYQGRVRTSFDQASACFLLESLDRDLDVQEVIRKYDLIPRRRYFKESQRKG